MNAYAEYKKFVAGRDARPVPGPGAISFIRDLAETVSRRAGHRRSRRRLDGLDDRLLKDVGLFREHLPDGGIRIRRR